MFGLFEYQSSSKHFAKSGQLIEARVLVFFFGRFLFFQAPASYHLRLFSWMMDNFWEKSGQPLMRDLFFIFRAALFALLLLYFLLRPLRHCCYTLVEEARQKEFLWKGDRRTTYIPLFFSWQTWHFHFIQMNSWPRVSVKF